VDLLKAIWAWMLQKELSMANIDGVAMSLNAHNNPKTIYMVDTDWYITRR